MNILITNDDGIDFKGLRDLIDVFSQLGDVYVVAPDKERSSNSHCLTVSGDVRIEERIIPNTRKAYAVWGTPADCVYLGLFLLFKDEIDLVVSGVNKGLNASTDIIYSGTIAAAREAFINNIPSLAVSIDSFVTDDFSLAAKWALKLARIYLKDENRRNYFLNINVPDLPEDKIRGVKVTDRQCRVHYDNALSIEEVNGQHFIRVNDCVITVDTDLEDLRIDYSAVKAAYVSVSLMDNDHFNHAYTESAGKVYSE